MIRGQNAMSTERNVVEEHTVIPRSMPLHAGSFAVRTLYIAVSMTHSVSFQDELYIQIWTYPL